MVEKHKLEIKDPENIFSELASALIPHREKETGQVEFIVEGTKENPIIGIRYPGKKVRKRELKVKRADSADWANLLDFEVIPYRGGKKLNSREFTFENLLKDFDEHKKDDKKFWKLIKEIHDRNELTEEPPELPGIDSKLFLLALKWLWIQEDVNYRLTWEDTGVSPEHKYFLETRKGNRVKKGAGRNKFYGALYLLKEGEFSVEKVMKIIPTYA